MNKIIIVTGASKGIGREIAKQLAIKGNTIIANYNKTLILYAEWVYYVQIEHGK